MRYRRNRVLPVTEIRPVLFQLANALSHLGSLGIVHADLKPGNIMVVDRYECPIKVKLTDFGFACPASTVIPGDCVGTDTRCIKLKCLDDLEQLLKIRGCWEKIQNVFVSLIKEMLALDPNQRITPSEVLHHPFFNPGLSKSSPCTDMSSHYEVEGFLGEGVNKNNPEILQQAKMEILILEQLRGLDADRCNIVQWNDFFIDGDRICLNFELLDQSLWDYIEDPENQGLPISEIRPILHQLTNALSHLGSVGIVHADLKPGNIMVVDRYECPIKVKLIDFGIACPASTVIPGDCVGTVGYKAPEVMIGSLFNEAIDMWSLGLVAVELATGQFQDETDYQSNDTRSIKLKCLDDLGLMLSIMWGWEKIQTVFVSLIKEMLALDPNQRITPSEVLHHPFFNPGLSKSSPCTDMSSTGGQNLV
uniref:Protein kinase domain-containing protein n=1 Tax=Astatotilapia calliptera TaxID=8154 RepID=A0A3P8Q096_ASTCA